MEIRAYAAAWRYGWILVLALVPAPAGTWAQTVMSEQFEYAVGPEPAWVTAVAVPSAANAARDAAIAYLVVDKQVRVDSSGETVFRHMAMSPLRQDGLTDAAQHEITFNPVYETLTVHRLVVHRRGRVLDKRDGGYIRLLQRETEMEQQLYMGTVSAVIVLDDVRVGDVVEYSYSIHGSNPVFGSRYFSSHSLSWSVPVARVVRRVVMPERRSLQVRTFNGAPAPQVRAFNGQREYLWDLRDVAAYVDEGQSPSWYLPQAWAQLSEYSSWRAVRDWAVDLYRWNGQLNPQLQGKLDQWRALDDRKQAVREALAFVQREVRYFGVELGQNSHRPGDPNTVFARRFGDCKDKAQLLIALLRELGVEARPALVSSTYNRAVADWLPSPGAFDHVIVLATVAGKSYWLDATRNFQEGGLEAVNAPDYGVALIVGNEAEPMRVMQARAPTQASLEVEERFVVDGYEQPVGFQVQSVYRGPEAEYQRQRLARTTRDELSRQYLNYYARRYPRIEMAGPLRIEADAEASEVRVVEHYRVPDFWKRDGDKLYFDLCGDTIQPYTSLPTTVRRHTPLALRYPVRVRHASVLKLPDVEQFDVGSQPEFTVEDGAIRYRQLAAYQARKLQVVHDYVSKTDAVRASQVGDHIRNLRRINEQLCYSGWIEVPAPGTAKTPPQASNPLAILKQAVHGSER